MMWVFRKNPKVWDSEDAKLWQVGYYAPVKIVDDIHQPPYTAYNFQPISEHDSQVDARQEVHFLNGGN